MTALAAGTAFPDFALADDSSRIVTRASLLGKPFVLFVYPQDDTETCTAEALAFSALSGRFRRAGFNLLGMSPDDPARHTRFKVKRELRLTLLSDPQRALVEPLGCWGEKQLFGRRYMGVVRTTFLVDAGGTVARNWVVTRVAGHAAEVLKAAQTLAGDGTD
jgi:peroxiredoxin Q/BCP